MTADQERWAEALAIEKVHGPFARRWITERVSALAEQGDAAGVERMLAVPRRLDELRTKRNGC